MLDIICHRPNWKGIQIIMILVFLFASATVWGQETHWLRFTRIGGDVRMSWEHVSENQVFDGETTLAYEESFFRGGLGLDLAGYTYHPNLLRFTINAALVQSRSRVKEWDASSLYRDPQNTWDIRLMVLEKKPVHGVVYFNRTQESMGRAFLGRYYSETNQYGFKITSTLKRLPFRLNVYSLDNTYESLTMSERREKTDNIILKSTLIDTDRYQGRLEFRYKDYVEEVYQLDYQTTQLYTQWRMNLDTRYPGRVQAFLRFHDLRGTVDQTQLSGTIRYLQDLQWRFIFFSELVSGSNENDDIRQDFFEGRTGMRHRLFESLDSELYLKARKEDNDGNELSVFSENLNLGYRKRIPTGVLTVQLNQRLEQQDYAGKGVVSQGVQDGSFNGGDTLILNAVGIDLSTLVVTSSDLSRLFVEGVDYHVLVMGTTLVLTRIPGGNIEPEDGVRVTYMAQPQPDFTMDVHDHAERIQIRFLKMLRVGYERRTSRNDVTSEFVVAPFEEYQVSKYLAGLDSRYLTVSGYKEDYEGTFSAYEATNLRATLRYSFRNRYRLAYTISRNDIDFLTSEHFSRFDNRYASFSWHTTHGFSGDVGYLEIDYETPAYERRRKSVRAKAQWPIRKLLLTGFYEYILEDSDISRRRHSYYIFSVKRRF